MSQAQNFSGKNQVLTTRNGNLLCLIQGKGVIYLKGQTLGYAPHDQHEIERGYPLDNREWNWLLSKAKQTIREATQQEVKAATTAFEERAEMLKRKSNNSRYFPCSICINSS